MGRTRTWWLLANLAFESDVGFNHEFGAEVSQAFCQGFPLIPLQDDAEVRGRDVMAIDRVTQSIFLIRHLRVFVNDQSVAVEVKVHPLGSGTTLHGR